MKLKELSFRSINYLSSFEFLKTMSDPFGRFRTFCRIVLRGNYIICENQDKMKLSRPLFKEQKKKIMLNVLRY